MTCYDHPGSFTWLNGRFGGSRPELAVPCGWICTRLSSIVIGSISAGCCTWTAHCGSCWSPMKDSWGPPGQRAVPDSPPASSRSRRHRSRPRPRQHGSFPQYTGSLSTKKQCSSSWCPRTSTRCFFQCTSCVLPLTSQSLSCKGDRAIDSCWPWRGGRVCWGWPYDVSLHCRLCLL